MSKAERIAPLLEQAVEAQIKVFELNEQIQEIIAGELPESGQIKADQVIENFVSDLAFEAVVIEGEGLEYAEELLEKIKFELIPGPGA